MNWPTLEDDEAALMREAEHEAQEEYNFRLAELAVEFGTPLTQVQLLDVTNVSGAPLRDLLTVREVMGS